MHQSHSEGLGLSLAIYLAALCGAFTLVAWPIYYANSPTVIENVGVQASGSPLAKPLYADHTGEPFPLTLLKKQEIVDAQSRAALESFAKANEAPQRRAATASARPQHTREQAASNEYASERPQQKQRSFFPFFSLF